MLKHVFGAAPRNSRLTEVALLLLRVMTGLTMVLAHGIYKIPPSAGFIEGVADMGFPAPVFFAWMAGLTEFLGGLLLALGLATRPAALFILPTMFTAAFIRNGGEPFGQMEKAILYMFIMFTFVLIGAGRYSIDHWLRGKTQS